MLFDLEYLQTLGIEKFDGSRHDRVPFTCGVNRIDTFLKNSASGFFKDDDGRIYVVLEREGGRLVGFYAIGPHSIDVSALNPDIVKRGLRADKLPAFYLSMIGTHADVQGMGVGTHLLADAFSAALPPPRLSAAGSSFSTQSMIALPRYMRAPGSSAL
jgi:GNAT superfamily N-acetyltransferase